MNRLDDELPGMHDALLRAIGDEPVMPSQPGDDVARGRRLVRRKRLAAVTVTAVTVPVLGVGGWALSLGLATGSAPGGGERTCNLPESGGLVENVVTVHLRDGQSERASGISER